MGLGVSLMTMLSNPQYAISLVKLVQSLDILSFINVRIPPIVLKFLLEIDFNMFKVIPNIVQVEESDYGCFIHPKLIENEISCLAVNKISNHMALILLVILFKIFIRSLAFLCNMRKSSKVGVPKNNDDDEGGLPKIEVDIEDESNGGSEGNEDEKTKENEEKIPKNIFVRMINYIDRKTNILLYFSVLNSMNMDLFIDSWSSLRSFSKITIWSLLSNFILLFIIVNNLVYWVYMVYGLYYFYHSNTLKNEKLKKIASDFRASKPSIVNLFEEQVKKTSKYGILSLFILSIRDIFAPFFLIFLVNYPLLQILTVALINIIITLITLITRPHESIFETILEVFNMISYVLCLGFFGLIHFFSDGMSPN